MSARRRLLSLLCLPMLLLGVSACEGILSGIYDHPSTNGATHEGFTTHDAERRIERLYVDVVSYKDWVYVDLHRRRTERTVAPSTLTGAWDGRSGVSYHQVELPSTFHFRELLKTDSIAAPAEWDLVLHHYDVGTHGGAAFETSFSRLEDLPREGADRTALLRSAFVADTWSEHRCYEDLTGIYNYYIGYRNARTNEVLSRWMDMNVSNPPPTYAMSGRVYLLRMADGTHAALLFRNYMNAAGAKGFVTLDYIYPY